MTRLYKTTETIYFKVDDLEIGVKPMSFSDKMEIQKHTIAATQGDMASAMEMIHTALSISLRDIKGITTEVDNELVPYKLEFEENGRVKKSCIDDLLNLPQSQKISQVCSALLNGVPTQIIDPQTGKPLVGVTLIQKKEEKKGKK